MLSLATPTTLDVTGLLAFIYLVAGLLASLTMAVLMPPFQNPDEPAHFSRAEQVSRFGLVAATLSQGRAGAVADPGIPQAAAIFMPLAFHPEVKAKQAMFQAAERIRWSGARFELPFPNSALYPPNFYLPAAAGVVLGRGSGLSIVQTLYVSRGLTAIASVAVASLAILIAGSAAPFLFAVLCLPMVLSLFAAVSQDGLLIATSALIASLFAADGPMPARRFAVLAVCLACVCAARPPYLPFALLLLAAPWRTFRARIWPLLAVVAAVLLWSALAARLGGVMSGVPAMKFEPDKQLPLIFHHPAIFWSAMWASLVDLRGDYSNQLVGVLGWLDTPMPKYLMKLAWRVLAIAAVCSLLCARRERPSALRAGLMIFVGASAAIAIMLIQYITWTTLKDHHVTGVQGRYFLPLLLVATAIVPATHAAWPRWKLPLLAAVACFPIASTLVMLRTVILRYYVG